MKKVTERGISPLLREDPSAGTVGPIIGTVVVIGILVFGAYLAWGKLVERVYMKRVEDAAAASSTIPGSVTSVSIQPAAAAAAPVNF